MFLICGLSNYSLALFHVVTHAFFKALLFLTSGAVIHSLGDEQDIRKQGSLVKFYPFYYILFLLSSLSLSGFPFLSGYFSKDFILELSFLSFFFKGILSVILGNFSAALSSVYSVRLLFLVFFQRYKGVISGIKHLHKITANFIFILSTLCLSSLFIGYLLSDLFIGQGSIFFVSFFNLTFTMFDNELLSLSSKLLPLVFTISGFLVYTAYSVYTNLNFTFYFFIYSVFKLLNLKLGFDYIYNVYLTSSILKLSYRVSFILIDKVFLEFFGPSGISKVISFFYLSNSILSSGLVSTYVIFFVFLSTLLIVSLGQVQLC